MRFRRVQWLALAAALLCFLGSAKAEFTAIPSVLTKQPVRITSNSAALQAAVISDTPLTDYGFEYGEVGKMSRISMMKNAPAPPRDIEYEIKNLKPETVYEAHVYAANANGVAYGADVRFTTDKAGNPPVFGEAEADIGEDAYLLRIPYTSEKPLLTYSVLYGATKSSVKTKAKCALDGEYLVATVTGMQDGAQIYFQARAMNIYGETLGKTLAITLPALPTPEPTPTPTSTPEPTPEPTPELTPEQPEATPEPAEEASADGAEETLAQLTLQAVHDAFFLPVTTAVIANARRLSQQAGQYDMDAVVINAVVEMGRGANPSALLLLGDVLKRQPKHVAALELAGLSYLRMGDAELASRAFSQARDAAPDDGYALAGLALCALAQGDSDQAYRYALDGEKCKTNDASLRIPRLLSVLAMNRYADLLILADNTAMQFEGHAIAMGAKAAAHKALGRSEARQAMEAIGALPYATSRDCYAKAAAYAIAGDGVSAVQWMRLAKTPDAKALARSDASFLRVRRQVGFVVVTEDYASLLFYFLLADAALLLLIILLAFAGRPRRLHMWEVKK